MKFSIQLLVLLCAAMIGMLVSEAEAGPGAKVERRTFDLCGTMVNQIVNCRNCCRLYAKWDYGEFAYSGAEKYCICVRSK